MSGPAMVVKGVLSFVDVVKAANDMFNGYPHMDPAVNKANTINMSVMSLCILSELGLQFSGASSEKLLWVKNCEVITRLVNVGLELAKANERCRNEDEFVKEMSHFQATISSIASLVKVVAEAVSYNEGRYLEMSPEELKTAKRYRLDCQESSNRSLLWTNFPLHPSPNPFHWTGHYPLHPSPNPFFLAGNSFPRLTEVPVDIEECKAYHKFFSELSDAAAITRAVSSLMATYTKDLYTRLRTILIEHHQPAAPLPDEAPGEEELNLTQLHFIPAPLYADPVFRKYICPITRAPIRRAICDPNGRTLYERSAITQWLTTNNTSPATRRPLRQRQLLARPAVQAEIDQRLREHQNFLDTFLQNHNPPVNAELQAAANLEHPV